MKKSLRIALPGIIFMHFFAAFCCGIEEAQVRVAHNSVHVLSIDVCLSENVLFYALPFGDITEYTNLPTGKYEMQFYPGGSKCQGTAISEVKKIKLGVKAYTIHVAGQPEKIKPVIQTDTAEIQMDSEVHSRFVKASQNKKKCRPRLESQSSPFGEEEGTCCSE